MDHRSNVRDFIAKECMEEEDARELTDDTPLLRTGILDSMKLVKLVDFLEEEAGVKVEPSELVEQNFGTIDTIMAFIRDKKAS